MFEDDDLDLDFGDSLLDPMTMLKSNPTFKPKIPSHTSLRTSNQPYPTQPPRKPSAPPSITQLSTPPEKAQIAQPSKLPSKPRLGHPLVTSSPKPMNPHVMTPSPTPLPSPLLHQPGPSLVRRFPGPAGLMPKLSPGLHKTAMVEGEREDQREQEDNEMECEGVEDCVAWKKAMQELGMIDKNSLVEKFNTKWIKAKDKAQAGSTKKMPFFLCKVGRLDLTSVDPLVMLVDKEGKVEGSMHRDVVDQFGKEVRVGSVLVLQRVAVLVTARREYVNITLNNLVSIYTKTSVKHVKRVSKEDMLVVARELDRVREQQMRSILGGDSQLSPSPPPPSLPPAWSTPQMRPLATPRAPLSPMQRPSLNQPIVQSNILQSPILTPNHPPPTKFTFKSHPPPPPSTQLPSQAQSQHLVASLLSDLDTSDIWSDF